MRLWPLAVAFGGVLIAALVATSCLLTAEPPPLAVVKEFWTAMEIHQNDAGRKSEFSRAYAHFDSDLQREQTLEEFQQLATSNSSFFRAGNRRWSTNVEDATATIEGWFTIEGDVEIASAQFRLVKTDDTWKIIAYRIQDELSGFTGGTIP